SRSRFTVRTWEPLPLNSTKAPFRRWRSQLPVALWISVSGRSTTVCGVKTLSTAVCVYSRVLPSPATQKTFVVSAGKTSCSTPSTHHPAPNGVAVRFTMATLPTAVALYGVPPEVRLTVRVSAYQPVFKLSESAGTGTTIRQVALLQLLFQL